ncbi:DUF4351 domain-containing protein [Pseudanabaena sp. UWO311]|nr:DUF4351 domain-containing protein [Pseudanabaena sp. UWO311]
MAVLENLAEAIFDFEPVASLNTWLKYQSSAPQNS